ncbi:FAD-dependent oxidoreductase [Streptomyces sp. URMC 123]|uniref:FAD-dependent oxidoreductase n=1 Tax=Streptomyces sp. URMC 123 TaxID=3423403 RepID=UPI003F1DB5A7
MVRRPSRVAVVGAGMAGLGAAWALSRHPDRFDIQVFEEKDRIGGNAFTVDMPQRSGGTVPVDISVTAFIPSVYQNFLALLRHCDITPVETRFSYAVHYRGGVHAHDFDGSLKRRYREDLETFRRMLRTLRAFGALGRRPHRLAAAANPFNFVSMRQALDWWGVSTGFRYAILKPMFVNFVLATDVFSMPAAMFARYLDFFDVEKSTPMTTWPGGTREIYRRMTAGFADRVHLGRPVTRVIRDGAGVTLRDARGTDERFDAVIMACNANQALPLLHRPSALERRLLGGVRYNSELHHHAVVHHDASVLPEDATDVRRTRSNFIRQYGGRPDNYEITYLMHNQQPWARDSDLPLLVTYNAERPVRPDTVVAREWFQHVVHDLRHVVLLQPLLTRLQGRARTWYCGAHTCVNSQEHALISGLSVARQLGADYPFADDPRARVWFDFYGRMVVGRAFRGA